MAHDVAGLIDQMRRTGAREVFDQLFTKLTSAPGLRPLRNHNTLAFYTRGRRSEMLVALRSADDQVVMAIPHGVVVRYPDVLPKVKAIWQDAPTAGHTVPNNRAAVALVVTSQTLVQAAQIIENVLLPYIS